jgi:hypothetical protein
MCWQAVAQDRHLVIQRARPQVADGDDDTEDGVLIAHQRSQCANTRRPIELDAPHLGHCSIQSEMIAVSFIGVWLAELVRSMTQPNSKD